MSAPLTKIGKDTGHIGRPKGALNKTTATAKEAIAMAAQGLGGAKRMIAWAKEDAQNERIFWGTIYPKLLPLQVAGADGKDGLPGEILIRIVDPRN
jgi:hypothetical protein